MVLKLDSSLKGWSNGDEPNLSTGIIPNAKLSSSVSEKSIVPVAIVSLLVTDINPYHQ